MAACDSPSTSCTPRSAANSGGPWKNSGTSGIARVARNAAMPMTTKVSRAPSRWPMMPPGNWKIAYPSTKACMMYEICDWLNPSAGIIGSAATVMVFDWM